MHPLSLPDHGLSLPSRSAHRGEAERRHLTIELQLSSATDGLSVLPATTKKLRAIAAEESQGSPFSSACGPDSAFLTSLCGSPAATGGLEAREYQLQLSHISDCTFHSGSRVSVLPRGQHPPGRGGGSSSMG